MSDPQWWHRGAGQCLQHGAAESSLGIVILDHDQAAAGDPAAALATTKVLPELADRFDGVALWVPVTVGSIADIVMVTTRLTSVAEVNYILREESCTGRYRGVLGITEDPLVSTDIIGDPRASVVDAAMTRVVDGTLVKIMSWYDNEWGFSNQMVREALGMLGIDATMS